MPTLHESAGIGLTGPVRSRFTSSFLAAVGLLGLAACGQQDAIAREQQWGDREQRPDQPPATPRQLECTVTRVADGDSMTCGSAGRVRILMIDAPELSQGKEGRDARNVLLRLMPIGTVVRIETDVTRQDQHGRILGYVYLPDGRMVNEEMARSGYVTALVYPPNVRHDKLIRSAVADARQARRGLWSTGFFSCSPRDHRARRC